jgi:hypothetical protein
VEVNHSSLLSVSVGAGLEGREERGRRSNRGRGKKGRRR